MQSGGHVGVESEIGKGTAFHVYLPLIAQPPDQMRTQPAAAAAGGTETILVVEDQAEVREFTATVLESYGYRVLQAEDGDRALTVCADQPVDLLLTDVVMPKMSGVELARRARSSRPELKTLLMSGYSAEVHERRGEDLAGAVFLQKPFSPEALAAKAREALGRRPD
jgi:DNA-binding response OmpR family regulator